MRRRCTINKKNKKDQQGFAFISQAVGIIITITLGSILLFGLSNLTSNVVLPNVGNMVSGIFWTEEEEETEPTETKDTPETEKLVDTPTNTGITEEPAKDPYTHQITALTGSVDITSGADKTFFIDDSLSNGVVCKVDGVQISSDNFNVDAEKGTVTLNEAYVKTLSLGTHSLSVNDTSFLNFNVLRSQNKFRHNFMG